MGTVTCEPDYESLFRRFVEAIPTEAEMLARKGDDRSLELVQSLTYVVTIALMAVHSQESLDELREAVADANKTLLEEVQERDGQRG